VPLLRPCSGALATALAGGVPLWQADLFTLTTQTGSIFRWTSWDQHLLVGGFNFTGGIANTQHPQRSKWNVTNTMEVPTLELYFFEAGQSFNGIALGLRAQAHNGALDGASFLLQRLFMSTIYPTPDTSTLGTIDLFKGDVGQVTLLGAKMTIKVRGKNSRLAAKAPRNTFQPSCIHTFCDAGCTLSAGSFTTSETIIGTPTRVVFAYTGTPSFPLRGGTVTMTSGLANGEIRSVIDAQTSSGTTVLTLAYPLYATPVVGDTFNIFSACDKTIATCTNPYNNIVNYRGFPYMPPPATAAVGQ
jgi:hypothetical protein